MSTTKKKSDHKVEVHQQLIPSKDHKQLIIRFRCKEEITTDMLVLLLRDMANSVEQMESEAQALAESEPVGNA